MITFLTLVWVLKILVCFMAWIYRLLSIFLIFVLNPNVCGLSFVMIWERTSLLIRVFSENWITSSQAKNSNFVKSTLATYIGSFGKLIATLILMVNLWIGNA